MSSSSLSPSDPIKILGAGFSATSTWSKVDTCTQLADKLCLCKVGKGAVEWEWKGGEGGGVGRGAVERGRNEGEGVWGGGVCTIHINDSDILKLSLSHSINEQIYMEGVACTVPCTSLPFEECWLLFIGRCISSMADQPPAELWNGMDF